MAVTDECDTCARGARSGDVRESIWRSGGWRVAHSFNSSLPGWLVVIPTRHVEALDELSGDELLALGPLLGHLTGALRDVTGCVKTYVMLLAEAEGFAHVHFHVVPRGADLPRERRGTSVFAYLKEEPLSGASRDGLARGVRLAMAARTSEAFPESP